MIFFVREKAIDYIKTKWFRFGASIKGPWSRIAIFPTLCFVAQKTAIAVKSDYRLNPGLQRTDAVLAAP